MKRNLYNAARSGRRLAADSRRIITMGSFWLGISLAAAAQHSNPFADAFTPPEKPGNYSKAPAPSDAVRSDASVGARNRGGSTAEKWEQELLRDPFWPVGFFPEDWQTQGGDQGESPLEGAGWKAASAKIKVGGTSQLGGRTAAIINGELKSEGDSLSVQYEGRTYQWRIVGISAEGRIELKKAGIK